MLRKSPIKSAPAPPSQPESSDSPPILTVGELLDRLNFSPEGIVEAAAETPRLFIEAGKHRISRLRERNTADLNAEKVEASRGLTIRKEFSNGGEKLTEKYLEALLLTDDDVLLAKEKKNSTEEADEFFKLLVEAYRIRRDSLEIIGRIMGTELGYQKALEATSEKLTGIKQRLRDKYPGA